MLRVLGSGEGAEDVMCDAYKAGETCEGSHRLVVPQVSQHLTCLSGNLESIN
jgi:hypothetical protein